MGAWGTNIKDNDTTADIYSDFFDLYNEGQNSSDISAKLIDENQELINNPDDCNNFWFAIALAQWETKSLDAKIFKQIKTIIKSGIDLQIWKDLDADEKDLEKRKIYLEKFLNKLQTDKQKAKSRKKPRNVKPIFSVGDCLTFKLNNGNYGGVLVLGVNENPKLGYNLMAGTRINQPNKPTINDFEKAEILIKNFASWKDRPEFVWIQPDLYEKEYSSLFELIGKIVVNKEYRTDNDILKVFYSADWSHAKEAADMQFEHEKSNSRPTIAIMVAELTTNKKWWKLW
jgi:hypothetical protein